MKAIPCTQGVLHDVQHLPGNGAEPGLPARELSSEIPSTRGGAHFALTKWPLEPQSGKAWYSAFHTGLASATSLAVTEQ